MEPFIRNDQFNFIKDQALVLANSHASVNDKAVLSAIKSLSEEKVMNLFSNINEEQKQLLAPISAIKDKTNVEDFLSQLKPFVIPFKKVTEQSLKKLFPKVKKLKAPFLESVDFREISYLGWIDKGSNKKFIVAEKNDKLIGLQGSYTILNKKNVCALCGRHEEVGLFLSETKGAVRDTFFKRGNYICQDSTKCNQNLLSLDKLNEFIERIGK
ncbi:FusB/FusC family EF-G-binding protein [Heyndrickxia sporothermodurans]|uniref:Elongation factor G-binding protein n=2 Tax=Heyndrickxia sporothermodurans TaxID=46224 RepID=A0A150KKP4_9BACI|nr:FusB/FusC family EF-G-binding protein [Heyndrickxia sporothermodurans]KYC84123.1 hypothetical protein B4102_4199 [Heyndrickxia sporothermodurans]